MNFGRAIEQLKAGKSVYRVGWNGKNMVLYLAKIELPYPPLQPVEEWKAGAFEESQFIVMRTADNKLIPWLASQTDVLAEDWHTAN